MNAPMILYKQLSYAILLWIGMLKETEIFLSGLVHEIYQLVISRGHNNVAKYLMIFSEFYFLQRQPNGCSRGDSTKNSFDPLRIVYFYISVLMTIRIQQMW